MSYSRSRVGGWVRGGGSNEVLDVSYGWVGGWVGGWVVTYCFHSGKKTVGPLVVTHFFCGCEGLCVADHVGCGLLRSGWVGGWVGG